MPNIVNPAVAVAAQGGGKFLHCITFRPADRSYAVNVEIVSEDKNPFSSEALHDYFTSAEIAGDGTSFTGRTYPARGNINGKEIYNIFADNSSDYGFFFGYYNNSEYSSYKWTGGYFADAVLAI